MGKRVTLLEFLKLSEEGVFSELETYTYVEALTHGFDKQKLSMLLRAVEQYIIESKEEYYTEQEENLLEVLKKYDDEGKELPYKEVPDLNTFISKEEGCSKTIRVLDKDKIFGNAIHFQLYTVYELRNLILAKLVSKPLPKANSSNRNSKSLLMDFAVLLSDETKRLLPFLAETYSEASMKDYAIMYIALEDLGFLSEEAKSFSQGKIVELLQNTFGPRVGQRGSFNRYINNYRLSPDSAMKAELKRHTQQISEAFKQL